MKIRFTSAPRPELQDHPEVVIKLESPAPSGMNFRTCGWSALTAILLLAVTGTLFAHADKKNAGLVFSNDKGKFKILLNDNPVGHEEFEISPSGTGWTAKSTTHLTVEGSSETTVTGSLTLQPDGIPVSYEWNTQTDKTSGARVVFTNGVARMNIQLGKAHPFEQDLTFSSPNIVVLDDNLYYQYAVLARVYDWSHRGTQTFAVLIPQELLPGNITVDWAGAVSAEGKSYEGLKVTTNDLQVTLFLDSNHRLMRLEVPSSKAVIVRE